MIRFNCDYSEGAHPKILEKLIESNFEQTPGYGEDIYCEKAARLIRENCKREDMDVHFLVGGTQTNLTVISAALRPHQGVIAAETGHVNVHESGAIEATGHKVIALSSSDGKITASQIQKLCDSHRADEAREHMVQPKLVYISNSTELGTVYQKEELTALSKACRKNGLYLYMDGARLGYALCAKGSDLDLLAIAELCDAFYIGATKIGALFGEALCICHDGLKEDFRYILKQKGGMLAKGRLLGLQFNVLLEDGLYFAMAEHANRLAMMLKEAFMQKGYDFITDSPTNQQFVVMPDIALDILKENYEYSYWRRVDDGHSAVRFSTSWATKEEDVRRLIGDLEKF